MDVSEGIQPVKNLLKNPQRLSYEDPAWFRVSREKYVSLKVIERSSTRPSLRPSVVTANCLQWPLRSHGQAVKGLKCHFNLSLGRPPSSQWNRCPGRPRNRWVDKIRSDNNLPPADLWSGGMLSVEVTAEWCYSPCWLNVNNNKYYYQWWQWE